MSIRLTYTYRCDGPGCDATSTETVDQHWLGAAPNPSVPRGWKATVTGGDLRTVLTCPTCDADTRKRSDAQRVGALLRQRFPKAQSVIAVPTPTACIWEVLVDGEIYGPLAIDMSRLPE